MKQVGFRKNEEMGVYDYKQEQGSGHSHSESSDLNLRPKV